MGEVGDKAGSKRQASTEAVDNGGLAKRRRGEGEQDDDDQSWREAEEDLGSSSDDDQEGVPSEISNSGQPAPSTKQGGKRGGKSQLATFQGVLVDLAERKSEPEPLTEERLEELVAEAEEGLEPNAYRVGPARTWATATEWGRAKDPVWKNRESLRQAIRASRLGIQPPNHLLKKDEHVFSRDFEDRWGLIRYLPLAGSAAYKGIFPNVRATESNSVKCDSPAAEAARKLAIERRAERARLPKGHRPTGPAPVPCCGGKLPAFMWT